MYDLMVAALQTDTTRVITYRQPVGTLLPSLGVKVASRDMSHYTPGDRMEASQKRNAVQSELLAGFLDKLKATKEPDGMSLFDHTVLTYGNNIRTTHYLDNCPTLIAGGGAGIKLGQYVAAPQNTPLRNAWLTILNGIGIKSDRHRDSTGELKELIAQSNVTRTRMAQTKEKLPRQRQLESRQPALRPKRSRPVHVLRRAE